MKTRIYLDFDGVLNAKNPQHDDVAQFSIPIEGSFHLAPINYITFSPTVVYAIERLRKQYDLELVWLSTWNDSEHVLKLANHLKGLDGGRVILPPPLPVEKVTRKEWTAWKAAAIIVDQAENPADFVWVDDHAIEHFGIEIAQETEAEKLYITPNSEYGLTRENLEDIEEFLKAVTGIV